MMPRSLIGIIAYVTWLVLIQSLLDRHLSVIRDYIFKDEGDGSRYMLAMSMVLDISRPVLCLYQRVNSNFLFSAITQRRINLDKNQSCLESQKTHLCFIYQMNFWVLRKSISFWDHKILTTVLQWSSMGFF